MEEKNKKLNKIIFTNLLLLVLVFFSIDIFCFIKNVKHHGRNFVLSSVGSFIDNYLDVYKRMFYTSKDYDLIFITDSDKSFRYRTPMNVDSPKLPILIMGCSFAYGNDLNQEQSFIAKLANLTGRPVYNRAIGARGLDEMLYQLRSDKFYSIVPKPEWVIYVFISDQIRRTQIPCSVVDTGVFYDKNLKLKHDISFPLLYTIKDKTIKFTNPKYVDFSLSIIKEIKREAQKHWGDDVKFFFLFYEDNNVLWEKIKPQIEEEGYVTATLKDLDSTVDFFSSGYKSTDNVHPSESAWDLLTPAIVDKLGL